MEGARKFLVVADGTPESRLAAYYAALRARKTGSRVAILAHIDPTDFSHWLGVDAQMSAETRAQAEGRAFDLAAEILPFAGPVHFELRDGELRDALRQAVDDDPAIRLVVLGTGRGRKGPGPLIQALARSKSLFGKRAVAVTVLPPGVSLQDLEQLV